VVVVVNVGGVAVGDEDEANSFLLGEGAVEGEDAGGEEARAAGEGR